MRNDLGRPRLPPDVTLAMPNGRTSNGMDSNGMDSGGMDSDGMASNGMDSGHRPGEAIMEAIREPLLLLDKDLCVTAANRAFCLTFGAKRHDLIGRPVHTLGDGQWNIPELRTQLENIPQRGTVMDACEVEREFSGLGRRTMLLNAREVSGEQGSHPGILLSIEDITDRRATERALRELLQERNALLKEIPDRVATSLQIVASVLRSSARTIESEVTRRHLEDAHNRVVALSALQRLLRAPDSGAKVMVAPYLTRLCEILAPMEPALRRPVSVLVEAGEGSVSSGHAVGIGLAVTELVLNALEHAFPDEQDDGTVIVAYEQAGTDWTLTVSDNGIGGPGIGGPGIGGPEDQWDKSYPGLGTIVLETMVNRLDASMEVEMDSHGTTVSVIHGADVAARRSAADPAWRLGSKPGGADRPNLIVVTAKDGS